MKILSVKGIMLIIGNLNYNPIEITELTKLDIQGVVT